MSKLSSVQKALFPELGRMLARLGMTVSQASEETGVSRATISHIIAGREVKITTISIILRRLSEKGYAVQSERNTLDRMAGMAVVNASHGREGLSLASIGGGKTTQYLYEECYESVRKLNRDLQDLRDAIVRTGETVTQLEARELLNDLRQIEMKRDTLEIYLNGKKSAS